MRGQVHIIGTGGVGSWLAASLSKLVQAELLYLHDGDTVEAGNLNRQFFNPEDIGKNKAEVLAARLGCQAIPEFFTSHTRDFTQRDWLICCADNNAARRSCLDDADRCNLRTIIAANERTSAEAYYYDGVEYTVTPNPREYYPELLVEDNADPRAIKIGCTGEAQKAAPQLVSANFMAASLAQWLLVLWADAELHDLNQQNLPYRLVANASRLENYLIRDYQPKQERKENGNDPNTAG